MIEIVCAGKVREKFISDGMKEYFMRICKYHKVLYSEVENIRMLKSYDDALLIALDSSGREMDSALFASFLKPKLLERKIVFFIGGADGHDPDFLKKCSATISLSKMTFPNQLVRLIFVEQLYRAFTILAGEKYHRE